MVSIKFETPGASSKLVYVLKFIESLYNVKFNIEIKEQYNFSLTYQGRTITLANSGILFQNKIPSPPNTGDPLNLPKSYIVHNNVDIKEDYLSGVFFMLSRSEEYQNKQKDKWGRYLPENSWASKNFTLKQPIADIWLQKLIDKINVQLFGNVSIILKAKYKHIHTIDVDNAFCYIGKGWKKNTFRIIQNLFKSNINQVLYQSKVLIGKSQDPYASYEYHKMICENLDIRPIYFIQPGNYKFPDTNISLNHPRFIEILRFIKTFADIGLHPSYRSNFDIKLLKKEKIELEQIIEQEITKSRQHYLVSDLPDTYYNLIELGIQEDYSMGYAHDWGFRAGTTHPFYFFDLKKNKATNLLIYPLGLMDGTLKQYKGLTPGNAESESEEVINIYKKHKGTFVSLWHNHTIGDKLEWKGWQNVFENQMNIASESILPKKFNL